MPLQITLSPKYQQWRDFLLAIPARMDTDGTWIYGHTRNLIKSFKAPDGTILVVKRYHRPHSLNKFIYSWGIRTPKGRRAYNYASILNEHGVETPEPVAYIEDRQKGILLESYLITLQCEYPHRMYEIGNATADVYEPMATAFARFTAHMHDEGILHLDYSPGNILWEKDSEGNYHFSLVDINRMRFGHVSLCSGCKNFARLWGPKRFFILVAREYAHQRGFSEDDAERITLQARRKFWTRYMRHHDVGYKLEL